MRTLSAGDVLRAHIRNGTEIGREAEGVVKRGGECVPGRVLKAPSAEISGRSAVACSGFGGLCTGADAAPGLMPDRVMMGVLSAELEGMGAEVSRIAVLALARS
jgi:hypothetical protein